MGRSTIQGPGRRFEETHAPAPDSTLSAVLSSSEWITAVFGIHDRLSEHVYRAAGLTLTRYRVLLDINDAQQPLAAKRLAEILAVSRSTVSAIVNELVQRGLVEVSAHPTDRRSSLLDVTADGRECLKSVDKVIWTALRLYWSSLDSEEHNMAKFGSGEEHYRKFGTWVSPEYLDMISTFRRRYPVWIEDASGLSSTQYRVLRLLSQSGVPLTVGTVASELVLKQNTVSSVTIELEKQGWLRRGGSTADGRTVMLDLTEAGKALADYAYLRLLEEIPFDDLLRIYANADVRIIYATCVKVVEKLRTG